MPIHLKKLCLAFIPLYFIFLPIHSFANINKHSQKNLNDLPIALRPLFFDVLARDIGRDHYMNVESLCADNPSNRFQTCFREEGIEVSEGKQKFKMTLVKWGRGLDLKNITPVQPRIKKAKAVYERDGLLEWYLNIPLGLEQGFTVQKAPAGSGKLTLQLMANVVPIAKNGVFMFGNLQYSSLFAIDADGKELPTTIHAVGRKIVIDVDDSGAEYPIIIDPLIEKKKLTASDGLAYEYFGCSVAMSDDGETILVGSHHGLTPQNFSGAAYVFVKNGSSWVEQQKIYPSDGRSNDYFGSSVSLSGDGNTALLGAHRTDLPILSYNDRGAAFVFVRNGAVWTEQQKITASDGADTDSVWFGESTGLSFDGNTAIIGNQNATVGDTQSRGAVYVYVRNGTVWTEQQKLVSSAPFYRSEAFGGSVAISDDGNTVIGGAICGGSIYDCQGAAYVFVRNNNIWAEQQELNASDPAMTDWFGFSVDLTGDGNTAVIGAPLANIGVYDNQGAVYVFTRSGTTWSQQQKLTSSDGTANDRFGNEVVISGDGSTLITGSQMIGGMYVFKSSGAIWNEQQKIIAADGVDGDFFGSTAALSNNGKIVTIGALYALIDGNIYQGAAYVFAPLLVFPGINMLLLDREQ